MSSLPGGYVPKIDHTIEAACNNLPIRHHEVGRSHQVVVRLEVMELLYAILYVVNRATIVRVARKQVLIVLGQGDDARWLLDLPAAMIARDLLHIPKLDPIVCTSRDERIAS